MKTILKYIAIKVQLITKQKEYDKAIESLEMAILKMPNHGGAYTNLGNVYNKLLIMKKLLQNCMRNQ